MASTLQCVGCHKALPLARFSKTQRREIEPECMACTQWRDINPGDAIPTPPPGGYHALRSHEKSGTIARVVPTTTQLDSGQPSLERSTASFSSAAAANARPRLPYDADDFDGHDDATHYSSTASYSIPTMSRFESAPTQAAGPAAPRFTQNLPGATVRANSGTAPPKLHGNSFAAESSRVSSAINSRARDTSSAPSSRFNRHAYGHPSTAPISQRGGTSVSGSSTSTKDKSSRKWPKGDNRKKFDVLPPFE